MTRKETKPDEVDLVTWLRCSAANALSLAACYNEEAMHYEREAQDLDPHGGWSNGCIESPSTDGLPDDWMSIAEMPRPGAPDAD